MLRTPVLVRGICSILFTKPANLNGVKIFQSYLDQKLGIKIGIDRRNLSSYEASGKTIAFVVNKKGTKELTISKVTTCGFILPSGAELVGSLIMFPHAVISWNVRSVEEVDENSLILLKVMEPKLDIVVLGYGEKKDCTPEIRQRLSKICKDCNVKFEALPTEQACGLFNFLSLDNRFVGGAFIPPKYIDSKMKNTSKHLIMDELDDEEQETTDISRIGASPLKAITK